jgi:hypothetical protein
VLLCRASFLGKLNEEAVESISFPQESVGDFMHKILSPAILLQQHRLRDGDVVRLYDAMHQFSSGFHEVVGHIIEQAHDKGSLLEAIWRGYACLWEASLQETFPGPMADILKDRDDALLMATAKTTESAELEASVRHWEQRQTDLVQHITGRLNSEKVMKSAHRSLLGEITMLKQANDELGKRSAILTRAYEVATELTSSYDSRLQAAETKVCNLYLSLDKRLPCLID